MSYNVSSTVTLSCSLTITHEKAVLLRHAGVLAEGHFLDEEVVRIPKLHCTCVKCGAKVEGKDVDLQIREFWWYGVGSGYMGNLALAASYTKGEAEVILVWEGGDSISAIKIKEGIVTEHEVAYAIGDSVRAIHPEKDGDGNL